MLNKEEVILNIIHLPKRTDRHNSLLVQMDKQKINFRIWEGEIHKHSRKKGICRSHKKIVQWAKDNKQPFVVIAEDDIQFFAEGAWDFYLDNIPNDYDLYFGMIYNGIINKENKITTVCSGMTLYMVNERFYDTFLSIPDDSHIDRESTAFFNTHQLKVCNPFVCEQSGSYSDNSFRKCDYKPLLRGRDLFGI